MSLRIFEDQGAAELNKANQVGRVESVGPATIVVTNLGDVASIVMSFQNEQTGTQVFSDKDTQQAAEDTGYDGNGALLVFAGQNLDELPVIPKSLTVVPDTTGPTLFDRDGDGKLYTQDVDEDESGTVDYFTGALTLSYPLGKEPDGQLDATYRNQDEVLVPRGQKNYQIGNSLPEENILAFAAADDQAGSPVKCDGLGTWL